MIAVYVHYNFELYIVYTCPTHKTVYNVHHNMFRINIRILTSNCNAVKKLLIKKKRRRKTINS